MGISSFSDFSSGLLPMLLINAVIFVAGIKQKLCSLFRSFGLVVSDYNMEAADQQMHDDELVYGGMNLSVASQVKNLLFFDEEEEALSKNPSPTFSSSSCNGDCAVCLCSLGEGDETSELPCCHLFHRSCIAKWLDYQVVQPTCPLCRSVQVTANRFMMIEQDELT